MQDVTELLFRVRTETDDGLERTDAAIKKIAASSGLTGRALEVVEGEVRAAFDSMSERGLNFEQIVRRLGADRQNFGALAAGIKSVRQELQDTADVAKNLESKQKALQQTGSGLQSALASPLKSISGAAANVATALGPVGIAISAIVTAATLGGKALFDFVDAQGRTAQETLNLANQIGISAGAMKRLQVEGSLIGVSFSTMQVASRNLAMALEEPTGAGKRAAQTLNELGIATRTASGGVRQEGAVFEEAVRSLSNIEDQTKRTEEATRLFGSRGAASISLLIANYRDLDKTARELGYGDTTQLQQSLAKGEQEINKMRASWNLLKSKLAETIEPVVIKVVAQVTAALSEDTYHHSDIKEPGKRATFKNGQWSLSNIAPGPSIGDIAGYLKGVDDQTRSNSIAASYKGFASGNADAMRALVEKLKMELGDKEATINSPKGVSSDAMTEAVGEAEKLRSQIASLEDQIKRTSQRESLARQLTEDRKYPGLQSPTEFLRLIAENQRARNILGPGGASLADSSAQYGSQKIADSIQKFFNQIAKSIDKGLADEQARQNAHSPFDLQYKAYQQQLKQNDEISKSDLDAALAQLKIVNDSDRGAAERQQSKAYQLAQLRLGGNNPASIGLSTQERIGSATNLYQQQTDDLQSLIDQISSQSDKTVDDYKELNRLATERVQMEATYYKEIDEARIEAEVKLAEMRKQELDDYKKEAASIFDALREPGGLGMQKWIRSQGVDLARGLFSNATAPILQGIGRSVAGAIPGQQNPDGTPTFIGSLTKGTILDANRNGKTPQIIAVDANTKAINLNTAALTGRAAGGVPAPQAAPGSIAGAAASGVSNTAIGPDGLPLVSSAGTALAPLSIPGGSGASLGPLSKMFSGGSTGGGQFLDGVVGSLGSAKGGLFGGGLFAGLNPDAGMTGGFRAGNIIGSAAEIGTGIYESVNQFQKGGTQGILGGVSAATLTAGQLAGGNSNPVGMTLDAIGGILGLIKSLFPNSADSRAASIANQTSYSQYLAPPTINQSLSSSGGYQTYIDKTGLPQVSSFNKIAETNPYLYLSPIQTPGSLYQNFAVNPGQVYTPGVNTPAPTPTYAQTPYGSPQINTIVNINAIDTQTGVQFLQKNMETIATGMASQIRSGHPVGLAVQQALIGT